MAIETWACAQTGCTGIMVFDNAELTLHETQHTYGHATCNMCQYVYDIVPTHTLVHTAHNGDSLYASQVDTVDTMSMAITKHNEQEIKPMTKPTPYFVHTRIHKYGITTPTHIRIVHEPLEAPHALNKELLRMFKDERPHGKKPYQRIEYTSTTPQDDVPFPRWSATIIVNEDTQESVYLEIEPILLSPLVEEMAKIKEGSIVRLAIEEGHDIIEYCLCVDEIETNLHDALERCIIGNHTIDRDQLHELELIAYGYGVENEDDEYANEYTHRIDAASFARIERL